jgi:HAD superfamily hydrolase (TIGR01459 family)
MSKKMKIINSLREVIDSYKLFIIDIYGVIHDGTDLYPDVLEALKYLKLQDKKIIFLSNAPRRSARTIKVLHDLGITEEHYDYLLTSGEFAYYHFEEEAKLKYYYLGPEQDKYLLEGTIHEEVSNPKDANIAIVTGLTPEQKVDDLLPEIEAIRSANLEMHCINPDIFVIKKNNKSHFCAGAIAVKYKELGGKVVYYGKPYSDIYDEVIAEFNYKKSDILCIGDGLHTDIKGANENALDSLLITSGMHINELGLDYGETPDMQKLENLCKDYAAIPNYVASLFKA